MKNESKVLSVVNGRELRFDGKITSIHNLQHTVFARKKAIAELHPYSQDDLYLYLAASASFISFKLPRCACVSLLYITLKGVAATQVAEEVGI